MRSARTRPRPARSCAPSQRQHRIVTLHVIDRHAYRAQIVLEPRPEHAPHVAVMQRVSLEQRVRHRLVCRPARRTGRTRRTWRIRCA